MNKLTLSLAPALLAVLLPACSVLAQIESGSNTIAADNAAAPLYEGPAADAVQSLQDTDDNSPEAQFALGLAQTLAAAERLTQAANRYGVKNDTIQITDMLGMPMVALNNPAEEPIDADKFQAMLDQFNQDLAAAQQTLRGVEPGEDFKLVVDIAKVRLDYNGDGEAGEDEGLGQLMQRLQQNLGGGRGMGRAPDATNVPGQDARPAGAGAAPSFPIAVDAGDVAWLHGYCHLLIGVTDIVLAHNTDELFNHTAHLFFHQPDTPYAFLAANDDDRGRQMFNPQRIADIVAFIHLLRLEVEDADRMADALSHFQQVSDISRTSWDAILAETDNDREWIPSPQQESVLGDTLMVNQERIDTWMRFLDEYDAILAGDKLLPFWRGGDDEQRGINLARVFEEPRTMDLVLWVQGSAATPYLEQGEKTTGEFWGQLQRAFRGNFLGFAAIVN